MPFIPPQAVSSIPCVEGAIEYEEGHGGRIPGRKSYFGKRTLICRTSSLPIAPRNATQDLSLNNVGCCEGEILMQFSLHEPSRTFLLSCWIPAQFVVCAACLVLAARSYPHYSMFDHDISFLGHPRLNPAGWLFWSAGMGLGGVMLWPVTVYMSRSMRALTAGQSPGRRRLVAAGTVASRCACFGLLGLALIPQFPGLDPPTSLPACSQWEGCMSPCGSSRGS